MKMSFVHKPARGQTTLEYLLLLAVVAVVVIAGFRQGSLITHVHDSAQDYYNTVTRVIMGENPTQVINGGWCPVTPPSGAGPTIAYASCECPAPAFGGAYCSGDGKIVFNGVNACGPCPTGQDCDSTGKCVCPDSLTCNGQGGSPTGSIPGTIIGSGDVCLQCICPDGTSYNSGNNSCDQNCPNVCTTWDDALQTCVAVNCGPNMYCDKTKTVSQECQCDQYAYYVSPTVGCEYCTAVDSTECAASLDGVSCSLVACNNGFQYCDTTVGDPHYNSCQCDEDPSHNFYTYWDGSKCTPCGSPGCNGPCTPTTACSSMCVDSSSGVVKDSCGNTCPVDCSSPNVCSGGTCNILNVNCAGTWSACSNCQETFTVITEPLGSGTACPTSPQSCGDGTSCTTSSGSNGICSSGTCSTSNINCGGVWSACSSNCQETFTVTTEPSGSGTACPASPKSCADGASCTTSSGSIGQCSGGTCSAPNINCAGTWGSCSNCQETFIVTTAPSGSGTACPASPKSCPDGTSCTTSGGSSGVCSSGTCTIPNINCAGTWSACSSNCEQTFTVTTEPSGSGTACPASPKSCGNGDSCTTSSGSSGACSAGSCVCKPAMSCPASNGCGTDSCNNPCGIGNTTSCPGSNVECSIGLTCECEYLTTPCGGTCCGQRVDGLGDYHNQTCCTDVFTGAAYCC